MIRRQRLETIRGLRRRPTVRASRLDDVGLRIHVKYEGANPTGSFKDRGTAFGLSAALAVEGELASDDGVLLVATGRGFGGTEAMISTGQIALEAVAGVSIEGVYLKRLEYER